MESSSVQTTIGHTVKAATGTGWATFAGIMFLVSGTFHVIDGIAALSGSKYLVDQVLFASLEFWGVVWLIIGALAGYVGYAIMNRQEGGREIGIALASLTVITQLMFINTNGLWALVLIAIAFMTLYALVVRGEDYSTR